VQIKFKTKTTENTG